MKLPILISMFLISTGLMAQNQISGTLVDADSKEKLAFVSVFVNGTKYGSYSDIDGRFELNSKDNIEQLTFNYMGYEMKNLRGPFDDPLVVNLSKTVYNIPTAEINPEENPAHRIINRAIDNKSLNDPERGSGFSYESYNKFVFTVELDSAIANNPALILEMDSSNQDMVEFIDQQHILLMESVAERKFRPPDFSHENILATRFSGLKNPEFTLLASQIQSFSFYEEQVTVGEYNYLSPLAKGSTRKYLFVIQDTTYINQDTVFVISYRPRKGKNFDGLQGFLHINTNGYAIQHVTAQPWELENLYNIRIQQKYEFMGGEKWFPVQLNSYVKFNGLEVEDFLLVGIGRSYLQNIKIDTVFKKREFNHVALSMESRAHKMDEAFWDKYRHDPLSPQDLGTYEFMDSIGDAENLDMKIKGLQAILTGEIPIGPVNLDLNRLMAFNAYEGTRLGIGLHTNHKISEKYRLGGYFAYGFKDKASKYGADFSANIIPKRDITAGLSYSNDVVEFGGYDFDRTTPFLQPDTYYKLFVNRMDRVEEFRGKVGFRILRDFSVTSYLAHQFRQSFDGYELRNGATEEITLLRSSFDITEAGLQIRFAYKEKFMQMPNRNVSLGSDFPIVYVNIARGTNILDGDLAYTKIEAMAEQSLTIKNAGTFSFQLVGGMTPDHLPLGMLFNARGSAATFSIATPNAFETMTPNEFQSSSFVHFHLRHNFENFLVKTEKFRPQFILVHSMGFGQMKFKEDHVGLPVQSYDNGFFESGLQVDNILTYNFSGYGLGFFYRYGSYSHQEFLDNIAMKLSFGFSF